MAAFTHVSRERAGRFSNGTIGSGIAAIGSRSLWQRPRIISNSLWPVPTNRQPTRYIGNSERILLVPCTICEPVVSMII
jgi:hypothetical protein